MPIQITGPVLILLVSAATALSLLVRPFRWPEAVWAVLAASLLTASGLIAPNDALAGIAKGLDVYLFLIGMMIIAELARQEGLFDWLAAMATGHAKGSPRRLFVLVYLVGMVVTIFMSNDATAVVLTPAVYAACQAARVKNPFPYLLICAFIANAASFALPISNPANLVIFNGGHMPPLWGWLSTFALPSCLSIGVTFLVLFLTQRKALASDAIASEVPRVSLTATGKITGLGLVATAIGLTAASAFNLNLGWPTLAAGVLALLLVSLLKKNIPTAVLKGISWSVIPLVAGLFVVVEALEQSGSVATLAAALQALVEAHGTLGEVSAGAITAFIANLVNNLPAGLVAGNVVQSLHASHTLSAAILIGIDLGPNLSITGSLATILWLNALRRVGIHVGFWQFLKIGAIVTIPSLFAAFAVLMIQGLL